MTASRSTRRRTRLVAASVLVLGVATAASACSAGQLTQTASQVPAITGVNANAGADGQIALRDLVVAYGGDQGYPAGGRAPLIVRIFNQGLTAVNLVGVTATDAARSVTLVGGAARATTAAAPSAPAAPGVLATPSAPATPVAEPSPTAEANATASAAPTPAAPSPTAPSPVVAPPAGQTAINVSIPPGSYVLLVPGQGPYLQLTDLTKALTPGMSVQLTFTFSDGSTAVVNTPFAVPTVPAPRSPVEAPHEENE